MQQPPIPPPSALAPMVLTAASDFSEDDDDPEMDAYRRRARRSGVFGDAASIASDLENDHVPLDDGIEDEDVRGGLHNLSRPPSVSAVSPRLSHYHPHNPPTRTLSASPILAAAESPAAEFREHAMNLLHTVLLRAGVLTAASSNPNSGSSSPTGTGGAPQAVVSPEDLLTLAELCYALMQQNEAADHRLGAAVDDARALADRAARAEDARDLLDRQLHLTTSTSKASAHEQDAVMHDLRIEHRRACDDLRATRAALDNVSAQLTNALATNAALDQELVRLRRADRTAANLRARLARGDAELTLLADENAVLKTELARVAAGLSDERAALESRVAREAEREQQLGLENELLRAQVREAEVREGELRRQCEALARDVAEYSDLLHDAREELAYLEEERESVASEGAGTVASLGEDLSFVSAGGANETFNSTYVLSATDFSIPTSPGGAGPNGGVQSSPLNVWASSSLSSSSLAVETAHAQVQVGPSALMESMPAAPLSPGQRRHDPITAVAAEPTSEAESGPNDSGEDEDNDQIPRSKSAARQPLPPPRFPMRRLSTPTATVASLAQLRSPWRQSRGASASPGSSPSTSPSGAARGFFRRSRPLLDDPPTTSTTTPLHHLSLTLDPSMTLLDRLRSRGSRLHLASAAVASPTSTTSRGMPPPLPPATSRSRTAPVLHGSGGGGGGIHALDDGLSLSFLAGMSARAVPIAPSAMTSSTVSEASTSSTAATVATTGTEADERRRAMADMIRTTTSPPGSPGTATDDQPDDSKRRHRRAKSAARAAAPPATSTAAAVPSVPPSRLSARAMASGPLGAQAAALLDGSIPLSAIRQDVGGPYPSHTLPVNMSLLHWKLLASPHLAGARGYMADVLDLSQRRVSATSTASSTPVARVDPNAVKSDTADHRRARRSLSRSIDAALAHRARRLAVDSRVASALGRAAALAAFNGPVRGDAVGPLSSEDEEEDEASHGSDESAASPPGAGHSHRMSGGGLGVVSGAASGVIMRTPLMASQQLQPRNPGGASPRTAAAVLARRDSGPVNEVD